MQEFIVRGIICSDSLIFSFIFNGKSKFLIFCGVARDLQGKQCRHQEYLAYLKFSLANFRTLCLPPWKYEIFWLIFEFQDFYI